MNPRTAFLLILACPLGVSCAEWYDPAGKYRLTVRVRETELAALQGSASVTFPLRGAIGRDPDVRVFDDAGNPCACSVDAPEKDTQIVRLVFAAPGRDVLYSIYYGNNRAGAPGPGNPSRLPEDFCWTTTSIRKRAHPEPGRGKRPRF